MKFTLKTLLILLTSTLLLSACSEKVSYEDPSAVSTTSVDFSSTDLQLIAKKMVDSLLSFPAVVTLTKDQQPILFVDNIRNQTNQIIDTSAINNTISTELIQSSKFRFVDMKAAQAIRKQLKYQHDSGMVNASTAVSVGQQVGAQYMLSGSLSDITQKSGRTTDVFYMFTMNMIDLKTGLVVWQAQKQIRKVGKKSLFGL